MSTTTNASRTAGAAVGRARGDATISRPRLARSGHVGKGLLYLPLGLLAIDVALGSSSSASREGAIEQAANAPFGRFLLVVLAATLVSLVLWKALQAIAGDPVEGSEAGDRAKNAAEAAVCTGSAATAVAILIANWSSGSSQSDGGSGGSSQRQAAAVVMDWPAGRWLVAIAGLAAIGYGTLQLYQQAVRADFMSRLDVHDHGADAAVEPAGRVGYAARAAVIIGIGILLVVAGSSHDPSEATGLSGLLSELAGNGWGQALLWGIAVGLVAYGLFTLAEARYRRAT